MKIPFIILIFFLFLGCTKINNDDQLNYVFAEGIKIKKITNFKENYHCTGSYHIKKDTLVSQFEIQSKYSLTVIKLKNVSKGYQLNYFPNTDCVNPGYFSSIFTSVQYINFAPSIFQDSYKINSISLISDKEVSCHVNNDSIKSFSMNLNEYVIKINNNINKVIKGQLEYYGLKYMSSNVLFYKIEDEIYIFILTPLKKGVDIGDNTLSNLLFPQAS